MPGRGVPSSPVPCCIVSCLCHAPQCRFCRLCGGLDLGESLALFESALLLQAQDLESVKVGQVAALLLLVLGLGPAALLPLGVDLGLLPELLDDTGAGGTGQLLDDERCEEDLRKADSLSGDDELGVGRGTVNQNLDSQSISQLLIALEFPSPLGRRFARARAHSRC